MSSKCKVYDNWQKKSKKARHLKIKGDIKGNFSKVGATSRPKADQKPTEKVNKGDYIETIKKFMKKSTFTPVTKNL